LSGEEIQSPCKIDLCKLFEISITFAFTEKSSGAKTYENYSRIFQQVLLTKNNSLTPNYQTNEYTTTKASC